MTSEINSNMQAVVVLMSVEDVQNTSLDFQFAHFVGPHF